MSNTLQQRIREVLRQGEPNSRNLSAFAIDVDAYLNRTGLFSKISYKKSGDPACALHVHCRLKEPDTLSTDVARQLVHVWNAAPLGYGGEDDAYEVSEHTDRVEMRFVTAASHAVVTGLIEVTGFQP